MSFRRIAANLCMALSSLVLALALGEVLLRVLWPASQPTDLRGMCLADAEFGHRLIPNSSKVVDGLLNDFSTNVRINEHGFRSPEYPVEAAENRFRVALFGDSEIFGVGVDEADMLNVKMQELLNRGGDDTYEVLNFAMPAIGTIVQGRIFERIALAWKPDAVIFIVTISNDLRDDVAFTDFVRGDAAPGTSAEAPERSWSGWKQLHLYRFVRLRVLPHLPRFLIPRVSWLGDIPPSVAEWYANDDLEGEFALMTQGLSHTKEVCDRNGIDMYLTDVPARFQFDPATMRILRGAAPTELMEVIESDWGRPQRMLSAFARERGISYVDVLDEFRRLSDEQGVKLKHPHDGHLNARGTLELARMLADAVGEGQGGGSHAQEHATRRLVLPSRATSLD